MPEKREPKSKPENDRRTPDEIAEERIAEWKRDPHVHEGSLGSRKFELNLADLGLERVPESIRKVPYQLVYLNLRNNKIRDLPQWIGDLYAIRGIDLASN